MNNDHIISSLNKELDDLESRIEDLSKKYYDLKKENELLKERQEREVSEKFKIKEKNANFRSPRCNTPTSGREDKKLS